MRRLSPAKQTFPVGILAIFAGGYSLLWGLTLWDGYFDFDLEPSILRCMAIAVTAFFYGMMRLRFHPSLNPDYLKWLQKSPWTPDDPLPLGPVHLIWSDFVALGLLTVLTVLENLLLVTSGHLANEKPLMVVYHWATPTVCFMAMYLLGLSLPTIFTTKTVPIVLFILAPIVFSIIPCPETVIILMVVVYLVNTLYLKRSLAKIVLDSSLLSPPLNTSTVGWPTGLLLRRQKDGSFISPVKKPLMTGTVVLVLTAYLYATTRFVDEPLPLGLCIAFGVFLSLGRALTYYFNGLPPIGFIGRVVHKRWIIPQYDKAFIAPICVLIIAIGVPYGVMVMGGSTTLAGLSGVFFSTWAALSLPPSLNQWHYCGRHRYVKVAVQTTPQEQQRKRGNDHTPWQSALGNTAKRR